MCTEKEFEAAKWLLTQIAPLKEATVRKGSTQDDWDVRDVWLELPGMTPKSIGVRRFETGGKPGHFSIRLAVRMKDGTYKKTEFFKLKDKYRQCCHLYLQRWDEYDTELHKFVLVNMKKMRQLGFFEDSMRAKWSPAYLTWNKDAYFSDIPVAWLAEAGCVMASRLPARRIIVPETTGIVLPEKPKLIIPTPSVERN